MTGQQIANVLDTLLFSGIEALIYGTSFVDRHMLSIFNWVCRNNRRRVSSHKDKGVQLSCLSNFLQSRNPAEKLRYYVAFRPDRYVSFGLMNKFLLAVGTYQSWYSDPAKQQEALEIERAVGCSSKRLWAVIETVRDCNEAAYRFRNFQVRRYVGLCRQEATKLRKAANVPVSEKDLCQNLTQAAMIALDKYDYRKGALTTYVRPWLKYLSQSPEFGHDSGLAYNIPYNFKSKISKSGYSNIGASLETAISDTGDGINTAAHDSVSAEIEEQQTEQVAIKLLQHADTKGILRLSLGMIQLMGEAQLKQMRQQMREEAPNVVLIDAQPATPVSQEKQSDTTETVKETSNG